MSYARRFRLLSSLFAVLSALFLLGVAPASAHMGVAESNPANGSQVAVAPDELTITFSIDVELDTAAARLRHLGGLDTPVSELNNRDVRTDALTKLTGSGEGARTTFSLPALSAGLYAIDWSVSEIGGHTNSSVILFKVTGGTPQQPFPYLPVTLAFAGVVLFAALTIRRF
jgi:copper transport protein